MRRLLDVPAVVAAVLDDVDLLEQVLSDVGDEELPLAVEGRSPGVAQPPRVVLIEAFVAVDERVVVGNPV